MVFLGLVMYYKGLVIDMINMMFEILVIGGLGGFGGFGDFFGVVFVGDGGLGGLGGLGGVLDFGGIVLVSFVIFDVMIFDVVFVVLVVGGFDLFFGLSLGFEVLFVNL